MKKMILSLMLLVLSAFAELKNEYLNKAVINSGMKIIDIRTEAEWVATGIIKDSITLTFFDERGNYNLNKFLNDLNKHVKKDEEFAMICRTGNRTSILTKFLANQLGYKVTNVIDGIVNHNKVGITLVKYK